MHRFWDAFLVSQGRKQIKEIHINTGDSPGFIAISILSHSMDSYICLISMSHAFQFHKKNVTIFFAVLQHITELCWTHNTLQ